MRRRVRVDQNGVLHCRKCGSLNLLARSGEHDKRTRHLKCADCDERLVWRPAKHAA
jgi:DNA-directed RNA polymerase subunit RPC12/RpoP